MNHEILLLPEVAKRLRMSTASVNRLLARRRKGEDKLFPLPISTFKGKGRWLCDDVDNYVELLSRVNAAKATSINAIQQGRKRKNKEQREKAVEAASIRLGLKNVKTK